ncbi:hypothetical protein D9M71_363320 [compost metagenome]
MGQAVVAPEAELVHAQFLVVLDAFDHFGRGADHGVLVDVLQFELRAFGEFCFRAWLKEAIDRGLLVAEPGIEGSVEARDGLGAHLPAVGVVFAVHMGVAQHHQLRAWHAGVVGQRGFELVLQVHDFFVAFHQRCDHDIAAVGHGEVVRIRVACSNPHRRGGLLDRLGHRGGSGEFPDVAIMGVVALPECAHHRHHFPQGLAAGRGGHATGHAVEFDLIGATGQADFHATVADHVEQCAFAGHPQWVPERRNNGTRAQVNGAGLGRQVRQQRHRAWRDGVFHGVVFANPDGAETTGFGHQGQFGQVFEQLAVADALIPTLHVHE